MAPKSASSGCETKQFDGLANARSLPMLNTDPMLVHVHSSERAMNIIHQ